MKQSAITVMRKQSILNQVKPQAKSLMSAKSILILNIGDRIKDGCRKSSKECQGFSWLNWSCYSFGNYNYINDMKKSNVVRSESQRKRSEKNQERISNKPYLSKHEKWENAERARIVNEALFKIKNS